MLTTFLIVAVWVTTLTAAAWGIKLHYRSKHLRALQQQTGAANRRDPEVDALLDELKLEKESLAKLRRDTQHQKNRYHTQLDLVDKALQRVSFDFRNWGLEPSFYWLLRHTDDEFVAHYCNVCLTPMMVGRENLAEADGVMMCCLECCDKQRFLEELCEFEPESRPFKFDGDGNFIGWCTS